MARASPLLLYGRARDRACPRKGGENARSEIQYPRFPRCCARARLGAVARCHGADRPLHRRKRQRSLPGYGMSRGAHAARVLVRRLAETNFSDTVETLAPAFDTALQIRCD